MRLRVIYIYAQIIPNTVYIWSYIQKLNINSVHPSKRRFFVFTLRTNFKFQYHTRG